jgi:hypothetical protein
MAVGGVGGMLGQVLNPGLDDRIATHLSVNPNPLAQQGVASQDPKAVDAVGNPVPQQPPQPGANLAPGAYTQPDPVNNSYIKDLMAAQRRDANAATFNEGMDQMAASFGTAQQQASKQAVLRHGGGAVGDSLGDLASMQKMQDQTIADNEHARFMANAHMFGETLRAQGVNVTDAQATEIMNGGKPMQEQFTGAAAGNATITGEQKNADAATRAWADAHPEATPQQIAAYKANLIAGGMGGSDLDQRDFLSAVSAGTFKGTYSDWKSQHQAEATRLNTQSKDATEFKDQAIEDLPKANEKLTQSAERIDRLLKDQGATMTALRTPSLLTSGEGVGAAKNIPIVGGIVSALGPSDTTVSLSHDIAQLKAELASSALSDVKNVRNRQEFDTIGKSLTAALDAANSPEAVMTALADAKRKIEVARVNIKAAAGHELTPEEGKLASSDYLTPTLPSGEKNPYFTGATIAKGKDPSPQDVPPGARQAPDGHYYVPDPARPGKYLRVD